MTKYITIGVIILIGVIASFFTVSSRSVLKFNDATIDRISTVDSQFVPITKIMEVYSDSKAIDAEQLGKVITESESSIVRVIAEIQATVVPKSEQCKDFHDAVVTYTKNSLAIVVVYKDKVLPYVKLHNMPNEKDASAVEAILAESIAEDTRLLEAVKAAQVTMASKHKIKLK